MLEFNVWFFVLVVNFLVLLYVLNAILFKPMLRIFNEREEVVDGSLAQAREMEDEKNRLMQELKQAFAQASLDARGRFEALRGEGRDRQLEAMEEAGRKAAELLEKSRAELRAEADKARQSLKADVERFSEEIVNKLVGV